MLKAFTCAIRNMMILIYLIPNRIVYERRSAQIHIFFFTIEKKKMVRFWNARIFMIIFEQFSIKFNWSVDHFWKKNKLETNSAVLKKKKIWRLLNFFSPLKLNGMNISISSLQNYVDDIRLRIEYSIHI